MVTYDKEKQGLLRVDKEVLKQLKLLREQNKETGDLQTLNDVVKALIRFYDNVANILEEDEDEKEKNKDEPASKK